jgi:hypothetical protein
MPAMKPTKNSAEWGPVPMAIVAVTAVLMLFALIMTIKTFISVIIQTG